MDLHVQEALKTLRRLDHKRTSPCHIIVNAKTTEKRDTYRKLQEKNENQTRGVAQVVENMFCECLL
jgi:hypothetical protein